MEPDLNPQVQEDASAMNQPAPEEMMPPEQGQMEAGGELMPDQEAAKKELLDMIEAIKQKYGALNNLSITSGNVNASKKQELAKELFRVLKEAGVDLTKQDSITNFLDTLKEQNPELYKFYEGMLNYVFSDVNDQEEPTAPEADNQWIQNLQ